MPLSAIVRTLGPAFRDALGQDPSVAIDLDLALLQHAGYVRALRQLGADVTVLFDGGFPDGCFVEDTAVIIGKNALITRPGAESRRPETGTIAASLEAMGLGLTVMADPALLDGGDVLKVGRRVFVGRSGRTNEAGIETLRAFVHDLSHELVVLDVAAETLHLKCHATAPLPGLLVMAHDVIPKRWVPNDWDTIEIPSHEAYAANTLGIDDTVLVAGGYPETAARIAAAGCGVRTLDTSEFAKAAGSLTCLSLIVGT